MEGNNGGGGGGSGVVVVGRAEIDTRAPFRSVKEAVVLFGERVLAGELHAGRRQINSTSASAYDQQHQINRVSVPQPPVSHKPAVAAIAAAPRHVPATVELEEAKQELEKEREEKQKMAGCIHSLQAELSNAMRELTKLKARDDEAAAAAKVIDLQVEHLKFVEDDDHHHQSPPRPSAASNSDVVTSAASGNAYSPSEFQKRRYVTFADPPTATYRAPPQAPLSDVVMELRHHQHAPPPQPQYRDVRFQRQMSAGHQAVKAAPVTAEEGRKKKKKPLMPLVSALFMRKKKSSHDDSVLHTTRTAF